MGRGTARGRALLVIAIALGSLIGAGSYATADDGRAVPVARSYPRGFATYDDLVAFATQVATDQTHLDADLATTHAQIATLASALAAERPVHPGGILWREAQVKAERAAEVAQGAKLDALRAHEQELLAAGAQLETGALAWRLPALGELTQPFGPTGLWLEPSRVWQGVAYAHFHSGVDIGAPWGSPIVAPADGRVAFVGHMGDGAEVVVIAQADGRVSMLAHLADVDGWAPTVAAGDVVTAGERVGSIGTTGMVTGAHVHWAVYANGDVIDPLSLIH